MPGEPSLDWGTIAEELAAPFDPAEVDFRPQGKITPNANVQLLAYIDARTVQDRLDAVLGIQNWQYDWTPVGIDSKGEIVSVKATLTIHGISKSDVGVASNFEGDKGAVSGGLKRAAVQWGIGRYLYSLPASWQKADANGHISPAVIAQLRKTLPSFPTSKVMDKEESPLPEPTPIRKPKQTTAAATPTEPTKQDWDRLKIRVNNNGMITNKQQWEMFEQQTGADYQEMLAKVEAYEAKQADLHSVPALDGQRRNH